MSIHASFRYEIIEATVQAGDTEIAYRRSGKGRPTILLRGEAGDPAPDPVLRALASKRMVVEPLGLPPTAAERARWLRGVVEGLGLDRPDLVVSEGLAADARRFLAEEPHRVGEVLLLDAIDR